MNNLGVGGRGGETEGLAGAWLARGDSGVGVAGEVKEGPFNLYLSILRTLQICSYLGI